MAERKVVVASSVGLHARPAALLVSEAGKQPAAVSIAKAPATEFVDARSILSVLGLGARCGDEVVLRAEGPGAEASLDAVAAVIAHDHDTAPAS
ncbi:HPr family phosphocarrier protein [Amycolatopsis sp. K13G38]|uniref:Phosphocarrier protein HPr n=1 Tax=Amycolatopsis acididurans TaxID=2724524 RepID=A0ABX1JDG6_9PSEU|nr:HPr family phosphocarrier protein [Amycolatopsis acididurans]NKQ57783.1 HPr family phosphocarrier protein [Amycolatopsis acididurans]